MSRAVAANRMPSQQNEGLNTVAAPASSVATQSRKQKTPVVRQHSIVFTSLS